MFRTISFLALSLLFTVLSVMSPSMASTLIDPSTGSESSTDLAGQTWEVEIKQDCWSGSCQNSGKFINGPGFIYFRERGFILEQAGIRQFYERLADTDEYVAFYEINNKFRSDRLTLITDEDLRAASGEWEIEGVTAGFFSIIAVAWYIDCA